jgi:hypothetical protein
MTYDAFNQIYISDVDASDLGLPPGRFPLVVTYEDRDWIQDVPKFSPAGDLEAYHYVPRTDADYPHVLCVWND